jgi:hypothetical protein
MDLGEGAVPFEWSIGRGNVGSGGTRDSSLLYLGVDPHPASQTTFCLEKQAIFADGRASTLCLNVPDDCRPNPGFSDFHWMVLIYSESHDDFVDRALSRTLVSNTLGASWSRIRSPDHASTAMNGQPRMSSMRRFKNAKSHFVKTAMGGRSPFSVKTSGKIGVLFSPLTGDCQCGEAMGLTPTTSLVDRLG